jgi:hypothetical protein
MRHRPDADIVWQDLHGILAPGKHVKVVWQNTYYNAKQYQDDADRSDSYYIFFNKVLTNQFER